VLLTLAALAALAGSCAYYNTFYLARRYYYRATDGQPYDVGRASSAQAQNYTKAIDYSKKVLGTYPKSKWVDDAYLMWAKGLIGRDDPLQSVTMLQDFGVNFPKSDLKPEAAFFLGLAYRNARRYPQAIAAFDEFLTLAPKNELVPYAHYERSLALTSMQRYGEAAAAAGQLLEKYPRHLLHDRALRQRAESRLQQGDYDGARADFHAIGELAVNDEDRFQFLMREVDCLESGRRYDDELAALRNELSHTPPPPEPTPGQLPPAGYDHYGRLVLRVGTTHLLAGRTKEALTEYESAMKDFPKTAISAEAQYRIGFTYETGGDDFDRALQEYAKVKEEFGQSAYTQQAQQRADNLQRIMQYRHGGGADSLEKKTEAAFLTAELYLFQLNKPDRALEEYAKISDAFPGTPSAGRALNAQAWVLSRKLDRPREADSLFWIVVRKYPATEAQLAARDYLEVKGENVPDTLIVMPAPPPPQTMAADTARALQPPPANVPPIGTGAFAPTDSLRLRGLRPGGEMRPGGPRPDDPRMYPPMPPGFMPDSLGHRMGRSPLMPPDSMPGDTTRQRIGG
jgi:tetratricopeptide (TPR) repeat protein